jgi:hypothetical protein
MNLPLAFLAALMVAIIVASFVGAGVAYIETRMNK